MRPLLTDCFARSLLLTGILLDGAAGAAAAQRPDYPPARKSDALVFGTVIIPVNGESPP